MIKTTSGGKKELKMNLKNGSCTNCKLNVSGWSRGLSVMNLINAVGVVRNTRINIKTNRMKKLSRILRFFFCWQLLQLISRGSMKNRMLNRGTFEVSYLGLRIRAMNFSK
jgi:hypothetical protein